MPDISRLTPSFASDFTDFQSSPDGSLGWQTMLPHHLRTLAGNGELEYYTDSSVGGDPFGVTDGTLAITARPATTPDGLPYESGVISTEGSFAQQYGYFTMRAELPAGAGLWPAFWLLPADLSGTREIDAMEGVAPDPLQYRVGVHSPLRGNAAASIATPDRSQGFHDYGVYWTPQSLSFWFDGRLVADLPTPADMTGKMFMIANLAISSAVTPDTVFPARMLIQSIDAYAYDPSQPGPAPQLHVAVPTGASGAAFQPLSLPGVAVADADATGAGTITVAVNDKTLGPLHTDAVPGVVATGQSSWNLHLTGSLQAVNAALATLRYENLQTAPTAAAPSQDTITVSATDADGHMDSQRIAIGLGPGPKLGFITVTPGTPRFYTPGHSVFVIDPGALADPQSDGGQASHLINFHALAAEPDLRDMLALHGFDPSARLVFDHDAAPGGVTNGAMQYYRVVSDTGSSPIFMVQMAGGDIGHLGGFDYGFYPS